MPDGADYVQEASLDAYDAMPIASFGEAMLRGMGWKEGMSVGRNAPKEVHAVIACHQSCIHHDCLLRRYSESPSALRRLSLSTSTNPSASLSMLMIVMPHAQ
jgi:hypothetical protein